MFINFLKNIINKNNIKEEEEKKVEINCNTELEVRIDDITIIKKRHEYIKDIPLPKLDIKEFIISKVNDFRPDVYEKCVIVRDAYVKYIHLSGYTEVKPEIIFKNFPINASENTKLLGNYISNTPFCKFLELGLNENELVIKLNQQSKYEDLNTLSSIIRECASFKDIIAVFKVDPTNNLDFLELSYIVYEDRVYGKEDPLWRELLQSLYTELFLLISAEHAMWHIIVSNIIHTAECALIDDNIFEVFGMASNKVHLKAAEVRHLLFGTPFIFFQVLNWNKRFKKLLNKKIVSIFNNFNIDTFFDDYLNLHEINAVYPDLVWIPGLKSNIEIIKNFVNSVISYKDISSSENKVKEYFLNEYNTYKFNNIPSVKTLLEILFTLGSAFHSTTFEYSKVIFTDVFYNEKHSPVLYGVAIPTIVDDLSVLFGDECLYKGNVYNQQVKQLAIDVAENRIKNQEILYSNPQYQNNCYCTRDDIYNNISINTYTTHI
jgi:hypothetical protein